MGTFEDRRVSHAQNRRRLPRQATQAHPLLRQSSVTRTYGVVAPGLAYFRIDEHSVIRDQSCRRLSPSYPFTEIEL